LLRKAEPSNYGSSLSSVYDALSIFGAFLNLPQVCPGSDAAESLLFFCLSPQFPIDAIPTSLNSLQARTSRFHCRCLLTLLKLLPACCRVFSYHINLKDNLYLAHLPK